MSAEDYEEDGIKWQCGTDDLSKIMSEASVEQTCPHLKAPINNCCVAHDDCYDKQLGQHFCDDKFCKCLDVTTKHNRSCNRGEAVLFCDLVKKYGAGPYAASATTVSPSTTKRQDNVIMGKARVLLTGSGLSKHAPSARPTPPTTKESQNNTSTVSFTQETTTALPHSTTGGTQTTTTSHVDVSSYPSFPFPFPYPS
ncbi:unnamed protein product [Enterobius vermicularis]|uniref:DB domain-containing protein n=1 Tax=Enterobius vermicularis TaxID=51028 RepID=A0A0N4VHM2_ENTVE|nr:unnamed protein product [Enterobius vermicularis]